MFRSKSRDLIIPQWEHARLAGTLATLWGNEEFDTPPLASFVAGVTFHDRGYDYLDNDPIMGIAEERWLEIQRRGIERASSDPSINLIVLHHIKRLALYNPTTARLSFAREVGELIERELPKQDRPPELFEWIDERTHILDDIAFDFSFGTRQQRRYKIKPRLNDESAIELSYSLEVDRISISPWPLKPKEYEGFILGYSSESYPASEPVVVPYHLTSLTP